MSNRRYGSRAGDPCPAGQHPLPHGWFPNQGCRGRRNDEALAGTAALVVTVLPGVAEQQVRQALSTVTADGRVSMHAERYRRITAHLASRHVGLRRVDHTGRRRPTDHRTAPAGRTDVADPRCADCGRPCFPRGRRADGLRICVTCSGRRRYTACGRCGKVRPVCRRLPDGGFSPAARVAGLLVLLFGQRSHCISRLAIDTIETRTSRVTITLGSSPIELPEPFGGHVRTLVATRRAKVAKRVTDPGPWLFPSQHPDRPALPATITHRLQRIGIQPSSFRAAALLHLAGELPPAVLGGLLGLGRTAVHEWSTLAGRPWASYVADRLDDIQGSRRPSSGDVDHTG